MAELSEWPESLWGRVGSDRWRREFASRPGFGSLASPQKVCPMPPFSHPMKWLEGCERCTHFPSAFDHSLHYHVLGILPTPAAIISDMLHSVSSFGPSTYMGDFNLPEDSALSYNESSENSVSEDKQGGLHLG